MLLTKGFETLLVFGFHALGGLDFNGHFSVAYDDIHLFFVVGVPVGDNLALAIITFVSDDFLHHEVLEGVAVIVGSPFERKMSLQVVGNSDIEIVEPWGLNYLSLDFL